PAGADGIVSGIIHSTADLMDCSTDTTGYYQTTIISAPQTFSSVAASFDGIAGSPFTHTTTIESGVFGTYLITGVVDVVTNVNDEVFVYVGNTSTTVQYVVADKTSQICIGPLVYSYNSLTSNTITLTISTGLAGATGMFSHDGIFQVTKIA
ncbi:MAG: hypothetical protein WCK81_15640, partial [Betaproteobacteria bacterium]